MPQDRGVGLFVFSVRSNPSDHTYKVRLDGYEIAAIERIISNCAVTRAETSSEPRCGEICPLEWR